MRQLKFHQSNANNWRMNAIRAIIYRLQRITRRTTQLVAILSFGVLSAFVRRRRDRTDGWILDSDRSANVP